MRPSFDRWFLPAGSSGLIALDTSGCFFSEVTVAPTASEYFLSVSLVPAGVFITTGLLPFACAGKRWVRTSVASCEPLPGSERLSFVSDPTCVAKMTSRVTAVTQTSTTA
jgi:hypothetical protein